MTVDSDIANRFIREYKRFLLAIYEPDGKQEEPQRTVEKLAAARRRFASNRGLFDEYLAKLEDGTEPIDRKMMLAIRNLEFSRWVYLRDLKSCSIFIKADGGSGYGVLGLTDEISVMTQGAGVVLEAGVVVLDGHYVCDGLIAGLAHLGPNIRASWNELYKELRDTGMFQVNPLRTQTLPDERHQAQRPVRRRDAKPDESRTAGKSPDARKLARVDEVAALLEAFSKAHLTPELAGYARKLWEQIGRKRKYVITGGATEVWAAAVVYVIVRLNFLFDSKNPTYLSVDIICAFFGTKKTTVMARAADIEKACRIRMGQEGLCNPDIADAVTFVKLSNGMIIPKSMARDAGLI